jgi:hypothetical protein
MNLYETASTSEFRIKRAWLRLRDVLGHETVANKTAGKLSLPGGKLRE